MKVTPSDIRAWHGRCTMDCCPVCMDHSCSQPLWWELWLRFRGIHIHSGISLLVDGWDIWQCESDCDLMLKGNLPAAEKT